MKVTSVCQLFERTPERWQQHPTTIVFVTHDVEEAALLSDRVHVMFVRRGHEAAPRSSRASSRTR